MNDLATLVAARLCHDFAGSLGAVAGVTELMRDADAKTRAECLDILSGSVARMTARLNLYRAVFADAVPAGNDDLRGLLASQAANLTVTVEGEAAPRRVRLALCCAAVGADALPRGGSIAVELSAIRVVFDGARVTLDTTTEAVLRGEPATRSRDAAAALAAQLAAAEGGRLTVTRDGARVELAFAP